MLCALCRNNKAGEKSHIVPAFVFRWLKESSPTGYLRATDNPNKREQDGTKHELLCANCEDMFSKWETVFCNKVFREVHQNGKTALIFDYEDWLAKFCVSISWRSLTHLLEKNKQNEIPFGQEAALLAALENWRIFLLGKSKELAIHRQHFLITDEPISATGIKNDKDLAIYFKRAVHFNTIHTSDECYVFTKMCDVFVCGTILDSKPEQWIGTNVDVAEGRYGFGDFQVSGCFLKFIQDAVDKIRSCREKLSVTQNERILEAFFRRNPEAKSDPRFKK